jgi:hypothetical protein
MLLPTPEQSLVKGRADFSIVEFRKLIKQKGLVLQWEQTIECPCSDRSSVDYGLDLRNVSDENANRGGHKPNCTACGGTGLVRHSTQDIKAIVTSAEGEETVGKYGLLKQDKIKITLEPEHLPSYGDRFTLKNSVIVWRETLKMPAGDTLTMSRPVVPRTMELLNGQQTIGVLHVQQTDANGDGLLTQIDNATITLNANGSITFTDAATRPAEGTSLSIAYYSNPIYTVVEYPHTIRDTFVRIKNVEVFSPMLVQCEAKMEIAND